MSAEKSSYPYLTDSCFRQSRSFQDCIQYFFPDIFLFPEEHVDDVLLPDLLPDQLPDEPVFSGHRPECSIFRSPVEAYNDYLAP